MKKRGFLILLVFLIAMETSFALSQDLVFSDTVYDKDVEQIEGKEFSFRVLKDVVSVGIDISGVIIQGGGCKIKNSFNICISNTTFAYRNSTTWEYIYKTNVKVYTIKSTLTVTKTIPKIELLIGEEIDVELSLENTADIVAENIVLTESYPAEILVSDAEGCTIQFNKVTFKGQVNPRQIKTCKYKLKGLRQVIHNLTTETQYFDGSEIKNITDTDTLTVLDNSLKVKITKDREIVKVGDDLELSLGLENINENEDLAVTSFIFEVPQGYMVVKKPKAMEMNNKFLSWAGKIEKESGVNESGINFTMDLKAVRSGKQRFNIDSSYKISTFLRKFNSSYDLNVDCDCPYIDYEVGNVVPGLKTDFKVSIKNPGSIDFKNLKIDYKSDIPEIQDFSSAFGKIQKNFTMDIIDKRIISPGEGESYNFDINIAYESSFGEFFVEKKTITVPLTSPRIEEEVIEVGTLNESETEESIDVESQETEKNITEQSEEKEEVNETVQEPIILSGEKAKISLKAIIIVAFIVVLIIAFVFIRVLKGKKEKAKEEMAPESSIEPPPEI